MCPSLFLYVSRMVQEIMLWNHHLITALFAESISRREKSFESWWVDTLIVCHDPFFAHSPIHHILANQPCEHLFHSRCICSNKILEETDLGCPMCKKKAARTPSSSASLDNSCKNRADQTGSYCSDGSVPSWAFVKLGNLLSSVWSFSLGRKFLLLVNASL